MIHQLMSLQRETNGLFFGAKYKLDIEKNLDEALLENLFDTSSYLFEEPENLLKQELRESADRGEVTLLTLDDIYNI